MRYTKEPLIKDRAHVYAKVEGQFISLSYDGVSLKRTIPHVIEAVEGCAGLNPAAFRECVEALHYLLDPIERPADAIVRLRQVLAHAEERG